MIQISDANIDSQEKRERENRAFVPEKIGVEKIEVKNSRAKATAILRSTWLKPLAETHNSSARIHVR